MSNIKILPEIISNKIAAGEVIERPASAVKELVENALDAKSTKILIEVEKGGRLLIRISDNGTGMDRDDAILCIERFATSKIRNDFDLFSINTLGFRGEALASISSVSKFTLVTNNDTSKPGTKIVIAGGIIKQVLDIGSPVGTMITVENLFYNIPARRKFLKTVSTELNHIKETVSSIAAGWPNVNFKLQHNGKTLNNWAVTSDHVERITSILGSSVTNELIQIKSCDNLVSGWISSPRVTRSTARGIYIFVNGRLIHDRVMQHALIEGYKESLMKGQFPLAVLFLSVPFDQVDVNVHPKKNEVRFANSLKAYESIKQTVLKTLRIFNKPHFTNPQESSYEKNNTISSLSNKTNLKKTDVVFSEYVKTNTKKIPFNPDSTYRQKTFSNEDSFRDLRVIGQLHNTYILCENAEGLILIDQHAAHERILLERFKQSLKDSKIAVQKLLVPETIELGYKEVDVITELIPDFSKLGFDIEPFGGNTFIVKSTPLLLADKEIKPIIFEMVEKIAEIGLPLNLSKTLDKCIALMSCHGAIKAKQPLSEKQIQSLLCQLDECDNPSNCSHGRPTWIKLSTKFFEKSFNRII